MTAAQNETASLRFTQAHGGAADEHEEGIAKPILRYAAATRGLIDKRRRSPSRTQAVCGTKCNATEFMQ